MIRKQTTWELFTPLTSSLPNRFHSLTVHIIVTAPMTSGTYHSSSLCKEALHDPPHHLVLSLWRVVSFPPAFILSLRFFCRYDRSWAGGVAEVNERGVKNRVSERQDERRNEGWTGVSLGSSPPSQPPNPPSYTRRRTRNRHYYCEMSKETNKERIMSVPKRSEWVMGVTPCPASPSVTLLYGRHSWTRVASEESDGTRSVLQSLPLSLTRSTFVSRVMSVRRARVRSDPEGNEMKTENP